MVPHSPNSDGYVRIARSHLSSIDLHHLESAIDLSIPIHNTMSNFPSATITGYTEWYGAYGGESISVGWDWAIVDARIIILPPAGIRTNIRVVDENGHDDSLAQSQFHIVNWIDTIPWRGEIQRLAP
jgi:hypothetical protein